MEPGYKYLHQPLDRPMPHSKMTAFGKIYRLGKTRGGKRWIIGILILLAVAMFLPWTQNIQAKGYVTTQRQEQRPQDVNVVIGGKVVKWFVKEGDVVKAGDTIVQLGEIKVDYLDPKLLERTQQQIAAKQSSGSNYQNKANASQMQMDVLVQGLAFKLSSLDNKMRQQRLKVTSDSIDLTAIANELNIYKRQLDAGKTMLDSGAISLIDFEKRKVNYQNGYAKKISGENKLNQSRQELQNLSLEQSIARMDYADKISKAQGEKYASLSNEATNNADISKLQNNYSNYDIRNKLYYITAPQNGQIVKAKKAGIGEILKEGENLLEIVPTNAGFAVEMYVDPNDVVLVNIGQTVRFVFDGVPAIIFSGWPRNSFGTFGGRVTAVENNVSPNGKFRVLIAEDSTDKPWPSTLRIGSGAKGIALLKDVPVYYELWRYLNGFPPEYYKPNVKEEKK